MVADFNDFNRIVNEKTENLLKFCVQSIDVFLSQEERISEFIKSGKLYVDLKKYSKVSRGYFQNHVIQERLREIYQENGWSIVFTHSNPYGYPFFTNKVVGITLYESIVE